MTNLEILALPEELLLRILANLDGVALARCAMTCSHIYETLKNSSLLMYTIQLHINGVNDSSAISRTQRPSYPELIEHLQRRHQEWMSPKWTINVRLELDYDYQPFHLVGGALVRRCLTHLEITRLPIACSHANGCTIKRVPKNDFSVQYLTIDPTQDVIVLIENDVTPIPLTDTRTVLIHIWTLSSDEPHPLAQQTPLQFTVGPNGETNAIHDAHLQIARNILLLYFYTAPTYGEYRELRVLVWDWTTSELILDLSDSDSLNSLPPFGKSGFGLLNSTYCFFTSVLDSGSIQLYELVRSSTSNAPPAHHLATLHLPRTAPNVTISQIHMQAGPIEAHPLPHTPFTVNDDDRLHAFTIDYLCANLDTDKWEVMPMNLFVHQRVFTKYCMEQKQHGQGKDEPLDIPWEEWGPANTRIVFPSCTLPEWSWYVHGQRVVCHRLPSHDNFEYASYPNAFVTILDFSSATILSARGILQMPPSEPSSKGKSGILLPPSNISSSNLLYEDDVETRLPCVAVTAELERTYESYMIYADGVVGIDVDNNAEAIFLNVYTI